MHIKRNSVVYCVYWTGFQLQSSQIQIRSLTTLSLLDLQTATFPFSTRRLSYHYIQGEGPLNSPSMFFLSKRETKFHKHTKCIEYKIESHCVLESVKRRHLWAPRQILTSPTPLGRSILKFLLLFRNHPTNNTNWMTGVSRSRDPRGGR